MILKIVLLFVLILINGFFSASEMAFVSINKIQLDNDIKQNNKKAKRVKKLLENSSNVLAVIQISITVIGFLSSAFAAETLAVRFAQVIAPHIPLNLATTETILIILVTLVLSFFTLILGELVPKRIALASPQKVAYFCSLPITVFQKLFYPIVLLLSSTTNLVCKMIGIKKKTEDTITENEIISIISRGRTEGIIDMEEEDLLLKVFKFDDTTAEKVMTPREKVIAIDTYTSEKALLHIIKNCNFSRIPVYKDKMDNIVGILVVKELLIRYSQNGKLDYKTAMHTPYFVDINDKIDDIFRMMQSEKQAMVIVKDNNKMAGVITLKDAVEEIVGTLTDEYILE